MGNMALSSSTLAEDRVDRVSSLSAQLHSMIATGPSRSHGVLACHAFAPCLPPLYDMSPCFMGPFGYFTCPVMIPRRTEHYAM